jgi:DNA-binding SARP family transcriptional activator/tetratricopeptide (TPR) repeat protein
MEFRLFGEVQLRAGGQSLDLGTPRQQAVLAALAVDAGRPVAIETLVDRVWDEASPTEARNVLYSHLSRIRQLLKRATELTGVPAKVDRRSAGYVLDIDPDVVDLHQFTRLAELRGTDVDRAAALTEALRLWRGTPLAGLTGEWVTQVRTSWQRRRLDAAVQWGELELGLGHTDAVIATMPDLIAEYPLAEPLEGLLMRALHQAGRDAEAVNRYAVIRQRLADELGTDPGPELRALHGAILRGELPAPAPAPSSPLATPAQLPPDVFGFAGRDEELARLDDVVGRGSRVVAVSGTAGVGKTSLAVHWAHKARSRFPGGQLYVNLRGFDPTGSPVAPAEAVRGFLDALGVSRQRIPASFEAQVGLYRSLLANRRALVVLDNARDAEQVRPLLPGSPDCLVLVTSRNQLSGLVAEGASPITVDLLDASGARSLLAGRLGPNRISAEPRAVDEIVALCARLPLALAVVAARAVTHPQFALAPLARELRDARGGLDEFASADPATDPRAVFSWSYLQLTAPAARLFRLVGLHPGPDISTRAAASLAALPTTGVRPLLAELARAHLVAEHSPGRYTCHDLLRAYASEQAHALDSDDNRHEATHRMLVHYVHSANNADRRIDPGREKPPAFTELPDGVTPEDMADQTEALAWFTTELRVLLSALKQEAAFDRQVWELAWVMRRFFAHQGHWHDELITATLALAAAKGLGDLRRQAYAHCYLGCAHVWFDKYEEAGRDFDTALDLYQRVGDEAGQAQVQRYYAWMLERQGINEEALTRARLSLQLFRASGHQAGQAKMLNAVGWFHALLDDHVVAIEYCQQALDLQKEIGDKLTSAQTWHSIGYSYDKLGDYSRAIECYQTAVGMFQESGFRYSEAYVLSSIGDVHEHKGDIETARAQWRQALDILDQLRHPDSDKVRAKISQIHGGQETRKVDHD